MFWTIMYSFFELRQGSEHFFYLDKCYFTLAGVTVYIFDGHLSVVFDPPLAAQDVMDAGCHFVPFVVVPKPGSITHCLAYTLHIDVDTCIEYTHSRTAHTNTHPHRVSKGLTQVV